MPESYGRDDPPPKVNPFTGMMQKGGIWCPWNMPGPGKNGPANMGEEGVYCMVWKNKDDFDNYASDNNFHYCRKICTYGHVEAAKQHNTERAKESFLARRHQRQTFAAKVKQQFKLKFPQLQVSKIAKWDLMRKKKQ